MNVMNSYFTQLQANLSSISKRTCAHQLPLIQQIDQLYEIMHLMLWDKPEKVLEPEPLFGRLILLLCIPSTLSPKRKIAILHKLSDQAKAKKIITLAKLITGRYVHVILRDPLLTFHFQCRYQRELAENKMPHFRDLVQTLLDRQHTTLVDVDARYNGGPTALQYQLNQANPDISLINELAKKHANQNIPVPENSSPLMWALEKTSPLIWVLENNHKEIALNFIKAKPESRNLDHIVKGKTALIAAIYHSQQEIALALIDAKANLDVQDQNGDTALIAAACRREHGIASALMKAKAHLNVQGAQGKTALICAIERCQSSTALQLIQAGADLNLQDRYGTTALIQTMVRYVREVEGVPQALIKAGANLNIQDAQGKTALMRALESNRDVEDKTFFLIEKNANIHVRDNEGKTALMLAIWHGQQNAASALMKITPDLNLQDINKDTALTLAIFRRQRDISIKLLAAGADVHQVTKFGETPLLIAERLRKEWLDCFRSGRYPSINEPDQDCYIIRTLIFLTSGKLQPAPFDIFNRELAKMHQEADKLEVEKQKQHVDRCPTYAHLPSSSASPAYSPPSYTSYTSHPKKQHSAHKKKSVQNASYESDMRLALTALDIANSCCD